MKRFYLLIVLLALFTGCAAAERSEFYQHDSMYMDWGHLWYSWNNYKHTSLQDVKQSKQENWWGETITIELQAGTDKQIGQI